MKFKISSKISGFVLSLLVSTLLLFAFYGKILSAPNNTFFSSSGDGLKSTYNSYYHLKYDSTYLHTTSMNYPYGESVLYTGGQPLIINTLKFLSNFGVDVSADLVGILNVFMLFTLVLGVVLLYLVLVNLKLPWLYSVLVANIIVFLSPQIDRFGGHYNLAYLFFLPLYLYLLQKFFSKPSYKLSIVIGTVNLIALSVQAYFFAMFSFWLFFILVYGFTTKKDRLDKISSNLLYLLFQLIIPFLLFSLLTLSYEDYRTAYPWGFFYCRASPESIFLPLGKSYGSFFKFSYVRFEGISYVGLTATISFLVLLGQYFKRKKKTLTERLSFTGIQYLDALFLGAFIALLISFAYPFTWHLEWLFNYTGPFKQFRASGRFAWLFYYTMNIIAYFLVWKFYKQKRKYLSICVLVAALSFGMVEAFFTVKGQQAKINNSIAELEDIANLDQNTNWINQINTNDFQSILPIPFFHVGSEVYWIKASSRVIKNTCIASWKTGLPISSTLLSRTAIPQTMKLLEYYFEPIQQKSILEDLPNNKDFLLIHYPDEPLNKMEELYRAHAIPIAKNKNYEVFRLPIDSIRQITIDHQNQITLEFENLKVPLNNFLVSDTTKTFRHIANKGAFPNLELDEGFKFRLKEKNTILQDRLFESNEEVLISFWISNMDKDMIPRTDLKIRSQNKEGVWINKYSSSLNLLTKYVSKNGWGLVEFSYKPAIPNEETRIEIKNSLTTNQEVFVNNLLIRPKNQNVYYRTQNKLYKNNRIYKVSKAGSY